jgi:prevent-host-death family protein
MLFARTVHDRLSQLNLVYETAMKTVNIHEAKTQLSKLIEEASKGESFVIAKAGKPVVKVTALSAPTGDQVRRLGFMAGQISVPDDFDRMGKDEIEQMFGGA